MTDIRRATFLNALTVFCGLGIFAAHEFTLPFWPIAASLLLVTGAAAISLRHTAKCAAMCIGAAFFLLGTLRFTAENTSAANDIARFAHQEIAVTGILREEPAYFENADGTLSVRYTVDVENIKNSGKNIASSGGLTINAAPADKNQAPRIGDRLTALGIVRLPRGYNNPGQIDRKLLLQSQNITARMSVGKRPVKIERRDDCFIKRFAADARNHYRTAMQQAMPKADAAVIFAMLFGGYDGIKEEITEAFTVTGIVHILSVSGSHISLLAATVTYLGTLLRLPVWARIVLTLGTIFFYSLLAGFVPPVIRSATMGALAFVAAELGRENDAKRLLALTGLVMLIANPFLLFNISFQLSFAATAGILYVTPPLFAALQKRLPRFVAMTFAVTTAAQAATLPITAYYFNAVSISALIANLIVVPIVEAIIIIGLIAGIVALVFPLAGRVVFALNSLLLGLSITADRLIASLPAATIYVPTPNLFTATIYYAMLCGSTLDETKRQSAANILRRFRALSAGLCLFAVVFAMAAKFNTAAELTVHFIDVGQGNAALIVTPNGNAAMIDTGGTIDNRFDVGGKVDLPYLLYYGVRRLNYIFLTHAHEDHASGAGTLLRKMPVNTVITANEPRNNYYRSMRFGDNEPHTYKLIAGNEGDVINLDENINIEILFAPTDETLVTGNELSNVYKLTFGDVSFLFTGDLVKEQETALIAKGLSPKTTVLQVAHHGSSTSSSQEFLAAAKPRYAVISVGADNSFGHPKAEVIDRLAETGATILRTDRDGAVVFHTDGRYLRVEKFCDK